MTQHTIKMINGSTINYANSSGNNLSGVDNNYLELEDLNLEETIQRMKDCSDKTRDEFLTALTCEELDALHQDLKDTMYAFSKIESEKPFSDLEYQLENWGSEDE